MLYVYNKILSKKTKKFSFLVFFQFWLYLYSLTSAVAEYLDSPVIHLTHSLNLNMIAMDVV
jgi:hypothetical protein